MATKEATGKYFLLHFIVLLLGFTAILGKAIKLPAPELVWFRMLIAVLALLVFMLFKRNSLRLPLKNIGWLFIIGVVIAMHWICFFQAIKVSNVSVTLGCLAVGTLFTSLLEPLYLKKNISWLEVVIGLFIIVGMYIIFHFETRYELGILYALIATFLSSLFSVLNKKISNDFHPQVTTFYEMLSGLLIISFYLFFNNGTQFFTVIPDAYDLLYLIILGVICTAFAFSAIIRIMQKLSAYQVVLAINLEPVYGIIAAWLIFGNSEQMTPPFYIGASIIILSVAVYTFLSRRKANTQRAIKN